MGRLSYTGARNGATDGHVEVSSPLACAKTETPAKLLNPEKPNLEIFQVFLFIHSEFAWLERVIPTCQRKAEYSIIGQSFYRWYFFTRVV